MPVTVSSVRTERHLEQARELMHEYVASNLVDLSSQNIEAEIAALPADYCAPTGELFIATNEFGDAVGCIAVHKLGEEGDAEIKRLFVKPDHRGHGVGTNLLKSAISAAREMKFQRAVLDTLPTMTAAIALYKSLGFDLTDPYWDNVLPVLYFAKKLDDF